MPFTQDIAATYRGPGKVVRRMLAAGEREDRALAILMGACVILFIARWPALARQAHLEGQELNMLLGGTLMATIFFAPLMFYAIALIAHWVARLFRGQGPSYNARLALFWSLLASSPLVLLNGLVAGFIGPGLELTMVGVLWFGVFLWFWVSSMVAVYREAQAWTIDGFFRLAFQTVTKPREAAAYLVSLDLSREALITAFALVVVLNTLFFGLTQLVVPAGNVLVPVMQDPAVFGISLSLTLIALALAVTACGRAVDGTARIEQVAILVIWLQALRAFLQAFVLLLTPVSLFLSGMIVSAATIIGIWIFVNFIDVAHGTGSLIKAGLVLLLAVVGMLLVLSMIFSLLGLSPTGVTA